MPLLQQYKQLIATSDTHLHKNKAILALSLQKTMRGTDFPDFSQRDAFGTDIRTL